MDTDLSEKDVLLLCRIMVSLRAGWVSQKDAGFLTEIIHLVSAMTNP